MQQLGDTPAFESSAGSSAVFLTFEYAVTVACGALFFMVPANILCDNLTVFVHFLRKRQKKHFVPIRLGEVLQAGSHQAASAI